MIISFNFLSTWLKVRLGASDDRGSSLVEYALLVALIAIACLAAVLILGGDPNK